MNINPLDAFIILFFITINLIGVSIISFSIVQLKRNKSSEGEME